jgi:hypothetical protein
MKVAAKPVLESFGIGQLDETHATDQVRKMSFLNWWNCKFYSGILLGVTVIYAKEHIG